LRRGGKGAIALKPKTITPETLSYDNMKLTHLRTRFSTGYANSNECRKHNIALALSKINGTRLESGEEFSFNKVVGARSEKNGFKMAKIIMDGAYVDGVGGGVCQASSTLYNAALLADMHVTKVRNHSLLSSYVKPSFDAMVNSASSDLRFVNTGSAPVFIRAYGDGQKAVVEFYGEKLPYTISTDSIITAKTPPPPFKEEVDTEYKYFCPNTTVSGDRKIIANGHGGTKSEGYLVYLDAQGVELERKLIRKDSYRSMAGRVVVAP